MPSLIRDKEKASGSCLPLKQRNQRGIPSLANFKRKKKNSKRIPTIHVVKGNVDIRIFRFKIRDDKTNDRVIKRVNIKFRIIKKSF